LKGSPVLWSWWHWMHACLWPWGLRQRLSDNRKEYWFQQIVNTSKFIKGTYCYCKKCSLCGIVIVGSVGLRLFQTHTLPIAKHVGTSGDAYQRWVLTYPCSNDNLEYVLPLNNIYDGCSFLRTLMFSLRWWLSRAQSLSNPLEHFGPSSAGAYPIHTLLWIPTSCCSYWSCHMPRIIGNLILSSFLSFSQFAMPKMILCRASLRI
jgi:hypothetical protein